MGRELTGCGRLKAINDLIYSVSIKEANGKTFSLLTLSFLKNVLSACFRIILKNYPNKRPWNMDDGITLLPSGINVIKNL